MSVCVCGRRNGQTNFERCSVMNVSCASAQFSISKRRRINFTVQKCGSKVRLAFEIDTKIENRRSGHSCRDIYRYQFEMINWIGEKKKEIWTACARREFNVFVRLTVWFGIGVACASRPTLADGQNLIKFRETLITLGRYTSELSLPFQRVAVATMHSAGRSANKLSFFSRAKRTKTMQPNRMLVKISF